MIIEMKNHENHEDEEHEIQKSEVTICNDGNPILKVEVGTTLKVIKLLCETVQLKRHEIIGVKPKLDSDIPCVITLDETKLEHHSYDLILTESSSSKKHSTSHFVTCSNEGNPAKTYINKSTNTETDLPELFEKKHCDVRKEHDNGEQENLHSMFRAHKLFGRKHEPPIAENGFSKSVKSLNNIQDEMASFNHTHNESESVDKQMLKKQLLYMQKPFKELPHYKNSHHNYHNLFDHARNNYNVSPTSSYKSKVYEKHPTYVNKTELASPRRHASGYHYHVHQSYHHPFHTNDYKRSKWSNTSRHHDYNSDLIKISDKLSKEDFGKIIHDVPPALIHLRPSESRMQQESPRVATPQRVEEPPVFVLPNDFDINSESSKIHGIERQQESNTFPLQKIKHEEETNFEKYDENLNHKTNGDFATFPKVKVNSPLNSPEATNDSPDSSTPFEQKLHCKICDSSFSTKSLLYKHLRGHTSDEKPFKCSECGQGFTLSSNLRQHRIIHRGYKPFQCEFCGKKFMRSNVYKQHRRIHTGEEMHKCTLCPSEFLQKYALIKHLKKNHNIENADV